MASLHSGSGTAQSSRKGVIPPHEWARVRPKVTRLYIDERKTLKQVMAIMKLDDFTATAKQYKTKFGHWGLHKNQKSRRLLPSGDRVSDTDESASSTASDLDSIPPDAQELVPIGLVHRPDSAPESHRSPRHFRHQRMPTNTPWEPLFGNLLHNNQISLASFMMQPPQIAQQPQTQLLPQNTATTVSELLHHCERGITHTILRPEDINEIEHVTDFLTLVCSQQDAFNVAHALLLHIAATPPDGNVVDHVARTAVTVLRNARALYDCKRVVTLLGVAMSPDTNPWSRDDKRWHLLLSLFGLVLQEWVRSPSQQPLALCRTAARSFARTNASEDFDWRYLVLITNSQQVYTIRGMQYDMMSAWRAYYMPRRFSTAISNIDGYLECLIMWCTAALDDAASWEAFNTFSAELWNDVFEDADVSELECKTLFCYFHNCLQSKSHVAPHSECYALLQDALVGMQQHLNITTWEALGAISRMLTLSNAKPYSGDNRSNLVRRALCRIQGVRYSTPPLGILTASGWESSSLSATFLETLAQQYCRSHRFSSLQYQSRVDAQVRHYIDHHLALKFSMDAFMHNPFAEVPPMSTTKGGTTASLVDLIMYQRSAH